MDTPNVQQRPSRKYEFLFAYIIIYWLYFVIVAAIIEPFLGNDVAMILAGAGVLVLNVFTLQLLVEVFRKDKSENDNAHNH